MCRRGARVVCVHVFMCSCVLSWCPSSAWQGGRARCSRWSVFMCFYACSCVFNVSFLARWAGPLQYANKGDGRLMMLPTDLAIRDDPAFAPIARAYAADEKVRGLDQNRFLGEAGALPRLASAPFFCHHCPPSPLSNKSSYMLSCMAHLVVEFSAATFCHPPSCRICPWLSCCLVFRINLPPVPVPVPIPTPHHPVSHFRSHPHPPITPSPIPVPIPTPPSPRLPFPFPSPSPRLPFPPRFLSSSSRTSAWPTASSWPWAAPAPRCPPNCGPS